MRRLLAVILCLGLLSVMVLSAGCGKEETTIKTPEGEVSVEEGEGGTVTFRGEEGEVTYRASREAPTEEELGAPIYPGAEYVEGSGGTVEGTSEGQEISTAGAEFTTDDPIEKVISWYREEIGVPTYENTSPREASWLISTEDTATTVSVSEEDGRTLISITSISGSL
ncbi:MAG: hypothetical protein H5T72_00825 [Actinobacteria bacterium]|nr:hypothetical protein [Actinomycetota bacterium]